MARATRARTSAARSVVEEKQSGIKQEPSQLSSPPSTPVSRAKTTRSTRVKKEEESPTGSSSAELLSSEPNIAPNIGRKRSRPDVTVGDVNDLPHNLGDIDTTEQSEKPPKKKAKAFGQPKKKPTIRKAVSQKVDTETVEDLATKAAPKIAKNGKPKAAPKKSKAAKKTSAPAKKKTYGLTLQETPYPNWPHPTPEECKEVVQLLSASHGKVVQPKSIPEPSLNVSGCGEVPSVLDALIRTRLSAATTNRNSSAAFAGLVKKFGTLKEGVGKGSVDWNQVRVAPTQDIFEAIECGGLGDVKSKSIKKILQAVWEENQARKAELVNSGEATASLDESAEEKRTEVAKADENVVSLDHLHTFSTADAFDALIRYDGIGVKTASCVLLFCLQRPSFAVDTHVFRLCSWLGWVPPPGDPAGLKANAKGPFKGPTRDSTFAHCEVRVPEEFKYPLHQLLIRHGKTCPRCRAITGENSEGWNKGCVIEHLVRRTGARKGGDAMMAEGLATPKSVSKTKGTPRSRKKVDYYSDSAQSSDASSGEESDMSQLGSVDEESRPSSADLSE